MSNLADEYDKLLNYLKDQKTEGKLAVQQKPLPKKPKVEAKVEIPKEEKKEKVLEETKKLLDSSQYHAFVPDKPKPSKKKGFDLKHFESMMRTKLIDEHKKLNSYERPYISVSELYNCLRQNYYVRKRYPVNLNDLYRFSYLYLIQRVGDKVHEVVQEVYNFNEMEKTVVSEKYKVKGRLDGIRESCLFEIKTIEDETKVAKSYIQEHYIQGNIYAYILNFEYSYELDTIVLIYVPRTLKKVISFNLPIDNSLAKSHLERAPILLNCLDKTEIPDPLGAKIESCKYCLYKGFCEKDGFKIINPPYITVTEKKIEEKEDPKKPVFLL